MDRIRIRPGRAGGTMAAMTTATKSTAKKTAPTKTAAVAAVKKVAAARTAEPEALAETATDDVFITFQGRKLRVERPTAEQIGVWRRTAKKFSAADIEPAEGDSEAVLVAKNQKAGKLLDRGIGLIESVLADEDDHEWLEDELLEKSLTLTAAAQIFHLAAEAWGAQRNEASTTGPKPQARRRR